MHYSLGIDAGGTYTDAVHISDSKRRSPLTAGSSTYGNQSAGNGNRDAQNTYLRDKCRDKGEKIKRKIKRK